MKLKTMVGACALVLCSAQSLAKEADTTNLYWGDTHLHSAYSFDAFINNNASDPDTAYRWAKGQPVVHPYSKSRIQIGTPLDFLVVSDHAEFLGFLRGLVTGDAVLSDIGMINGIKRWFVINHVKSAIEKGEGTKVYQDELMPKAPAKQDGNPIEDENNPHVADPILGSPTETAKHAWASIMDAVDKHYEPGKFTTLVGWEWTSTPTGTNLHRVVVSSSTGEEAKQYIPFGSDQSQYPQDLWAWLEKTEKEAGVEFISIPHNSNVSKGYMFPEVTLKGKAITADYAQRRMKYEPIVEVTQIKGDSETHVGLSPDDEFADFETYQYYLQGNLSQFKNVSEGDYARSALKRGLAIEQKTGVNPYKFGMIGSTDAHTSVSSAEEDNFWGKMAIDSIPQNKITGGKGGIPGATGWDMQAGGLAAVWAKENTREEIFAAFKRKEVYATTGPRIAVRFFGGWEFNDFKADGENIATLGYQNGTPMGGELSVSSDLKESPEFLIQAVRDPVGANLDRVQVVKGWVNAEGQTQEKVYNVAWSGNRTLDPQGKLDAVGDTVDLNTGKVANSIGAPELLTKWQDPDFDPAVPAFYYVRVLQIPTARHSLLDTLALGVPHPENLPKVIQERAYTSPIWYTPR